MLCEHYHLVAVRVVSLNEDGRNRLPNPWMRKGTRRAVGRGQASGDED